MNSEKPILWNRNFIQCCISYFFMSFAFYMLMPTMPVYLVEELKIDASFVGMALSSYTLGLLCVRPFSGYIVDAFNRKRLYLFAFCMFSLMFLGYLYATTITAIMIVRFIQGGFMGLTSVAGNTITIDVIPSRRRGEGMGFYGLTLNLSMSLAPVLAVALYERAGFHPLIITAIFTAFTGLVTVLFIDYPAREKVRRPPFSLDRFILVKAIPSALSYILTAIPYGMIVSFVVLYGKEIGVSHPGYFFVLMAAGVGISRIISGKLIDRGKIHVVSVWSILGLAFSFCLFSLIHTSLVFFLSSLLIGIGFGVSVPAFQYVFVNVAPAHLRGTATSTYLTSFDIGVGSGTLLAGYIATHFNLATAYLLGSMLCFISLIIYLFLAKPAYEKNKLFT